MSSPVILVTGGYDHKIRFWEARSSVCIRTLLFGETQVNCLQVSAEKSLLAAGGNPLIQIYDIHSHNDKPVLTYDGHSNNVTSVGFQNHTKWVYSGSEDGTVKIWDLRSNIPTRTYECDSPVNSVVLSPNQVELIAGCQNGVVKVFDLVADAFRYSHVPEQDVAVRSISIASDASLMAVGSHNGKVYMYTQTPQKQFALTSKIDAHEHYLLKCVISKDVSVLATTSADKTVKLWNIETGTEKRTLIQHQRWVWDAVFSSDSKYLVTVSSDQTGKLWDVDSGEVIRNYTGHNLAVTCVALNDTSN